MHRDRERLQRKLGIDIIWGCTVLLCIINDILSSLDNDSIYVLLLDLPAASVL